MNFQAEEEAMDPESPEEADDTPAETPPEEAVAEKPTDVPDDPVASEPDASVEEPVEPVKSEPKPTGEREVPASNTFNVIGKRRPSPPTPQELDNEDALYAQDVQRGHLKPETMADLFAKKDTLGKIGTLFGLLVAGAGSGLTGQPNAVIEMMNNQIKNDFEAQKISNSNSQNWLRLSQQHELQKSQLNQMGIQNELTKAQTGKIPAETEQLKAQTESMKQDALYKGSETTLNKMRIAAYNHLQGEVDKMPPGASKDAAVSALQTMGNAITAENAAANQKTSGLLTARAAVRGDLPPPPSSAINYNKLQLLKAAGAQASILGVTAMPGKALDPHSAALADEESKLVETNRATYQSYLDSFEHLDRAALGGRVNKNDRDAAVDLVAAQISKQTGSSSEAAKRQADDLFPSWKDWGNARAEKAKKGAEHFAIQESGTPVLNQYGLKAPFPGPPPLAKDAAVATAKKSAPKQESPKTRDIGIPPYKKVKGGWQKVK